MFCSKFCTLFSGICCVAISKGHLVPCRDHMGWPARTNVSVHFLPSMAEVQWECTFYVFSWYSLSIIMRMVYPCMGMFCLLSSIMSCIRGNMAPSRGSSHRHVFLMALINHVERLVKATVSLILVRHRVLDAGKAGAVVGY